MVKTSFSYLENRSNVQYAPEMLDVFSPPPSLFPILFIPAPRTLLLCYGPIDLATHSS